MPEGERLSSESETERLDKCDLISTAALYNLSVNAGALPPLLVGEALAVLAKLAVSPEALLLGELSSGCETERLDRVKLQE